jgi:hypothetical protein
LTESVVITALDRNFFTLWGRTKRLISIALFWKGETPVGEGSTTGHSPRKLAGSPTEKRALPQ